MSGLLGANDPSVVAARRQLALDVGERVRAAWKTSGLTRQELAFSIGSSVQLLVRLQRGMNSPDLYTLGLIAEVCKVPLVSLIPMRLPVVAFPEGAFDPRAEQG